MGRKHKHEEHENLERWLVSYADFITLLFATFVVLYALSQLDLAKFKDFKQSVQKAFSANSIIQGSEGIQEKSGTSQINDAGGSSDNMVVIEPIMQTMQQVQEDKDFEKTKSEMEIYSDLSGVSGIKTEVSERGLSINLLDTLMFDSGKATIKPQAYKTLNKIGKMLKENYPNSLVRIEGHTDSIPIKSSIYPSNWELSSARASSIVRYFAGNFNIPQNRFAAVGYADSHPVVSNSNWMERGKNRRVEVVVLRDKYAKAEAANPELDKLIKEKEEKQKAEQEKIKKQQKKQEGLSDAARELMKETGAPNKAVIDYRDDYDKETERLLKEIKAKEKVIDKDGRNQFSKKF